MDAINLGKILLLATFAVGSVVLFDACASSGSCRNQEILNPKAQNPKSQSAAAKAKSEAGSGGGTVGAIGAGASAGGDSEARVKVYKYDGSLQCGMGSAIPLDTMARELKNIKIFSKESKEDGLMRIQLCGSPTGKANVYEISKAQLKDAQALGFKEWTF